jgi:hypothetical protein
LIPCSAGDRDSAVLACFTWVGAAIGGSRPLRYVMTVTSKQVQVRSAEKQKETTSD